MTDDQSQTPTPKAVEKLVKRLHNLSVELAGIEHNVGDEFAIPNEAADAIESQAARIAELTIERDQLAMDLTNERCKKSDDVFDAYNDLASANKRIAEFEAALGNAHKETDDLDDRFTSYRDMAERQSDADGRRITALEAQVAAFREALKEHTDWDGTLEVKQAIKPGHGPCCTCQDCGRSHDECVCEHNEIARVLMAALRNAEGK